MAQVQEGPQGCLGSTEPDSKAEGHPGLIGGSGSGHLLWCQRPGFCKELCHQCPVLRGGTTGLPAVQPSGSGVGWVDSWSQGCPDGLCHQPRHHIHGLLEASGHPTWAYLKILKTILECPESVSEVLLDFPEHINFGSKTHFRETIKKTET